MERISVVPICIGEDEEVVDLTIKHLGEKFSEKDYKPKEVTPEELKKEIEKSKEKLSKLFKIRLEALKSLYGGKEFKGSVYDLQDEAPYMLELKSEEIAEVEYPDDFDEMKNFVKEIEDFKSKPIPSDRALKSLDIDFDTEGFGDEDCDIYRIFAVANWIIFKEPNEKALQRAAEINAIYKKISPIFKYDCEAVKEFLEGDLTFKGLARRLNPFIRESC